MATVVNSSLTWSPRISSGVRPTVRPANRCSREVSVFSPSSVNRFVSVVYIPGRGRAY